MASLAQKIVAACERKGWSFDRGPGEINVVYVEGLSPDGTANGDRPNVWNDLRTVIGFDGPEPKILKAWEATTEPGFYYTQNPLNAAGAARIEFGQYRAWKVGKHRASSPTGHEGLVQVVEIPVRRDKNKDGIRTGDWLDIGLFGINQHGGYDMPADDIGTASAGCLVGRTMEGHREFMALVKSDPRYVADHSFVFATAVIAESDVLAEGLPAAPGLPMNAALRDKMAKAILDFEARRDKQGRLAVYALPSGDGGGTYEVAGINDRYHPQQAASLAALIRAGRHDVAEAEAVAFIAGYTDVVQGWHPDPGVEFYLRDCAFNRGPTGAGRILQRALGMTEDGIVRVGGPTRLAAAKMPPGDMLQALRRARESYERNPVGRDESSKFWVGLARRWNRALAIADEFQAAAVVEPVPSPAPEPRPVPMPAPQPNPPSVTPAPADDPSMAALLAAIKPVLAEHLAEAEARGRAAGRAEAAAAAPKAPAVPASVGKALGKVPVAGLSISAGTAAAIAQSLGAIDWQTLVPILYAVGGVLGIRMLPALGAGAKLLTSVAPLARALAEQAPQIQAAIEAQATAAAERDRPQARPENLG